MRGVQAPRATPVRGWRNYRVAKSHSWLRAVVLSTLRVFDLRHATSCIIPRALRLRDQTVAKPSRNHLSSLPPSPLLCFRIRVSAWDTCVRACAWLHVRENRPRVLSSLFLPSLFSSRFQFGNTKGRKINPDHYTSSSRFVEEIALWFSSEIWKKKLYWLKGSPLSIWGKYTKNPRAYNPPFPQNQKKKKEP